MRFDRRGFSVPSGVADARLGGDGAAAFVACGRGVGFAAGAYCVAGVDRGAAAAAGVVADLRSCCAARARDVCGRARCAGCGLGGSLIVGRVIGGRGRAEFGKAPSIVADFARARRGADGRARSSEHASARALSLRAC
jgi:hypothetical protein